MYSSSITQTNIDYWRTKAIDYEWLYKEQRQICEKYRQIIDEYRAQINGEKKHKRDEQADC